MRWSPARELLSVTKINSVVRGVQIGAQAYSFRDLPLDAMIAAFREVGLGECELTEIHFSEAVHPRLRTLTSGGSIRRSAIFKEVRKKFDDAGISLSANGYIFRPELTDQMIEQRLSNDPGFGLGLHHDVHENPYGPAH